MAEPSADDNALRLLKHDVRNQLSNINLAIEQLRFELTNEKSEDSAFYLDLIAQSCRKINDILKD